MGATAASTNNLSEVVSASLSLQKLLVFFMLLDIAWMVLGYSFIGPMLSFIFHFIVFSAVKKQRTGVLLVYVVLNVIVLSFAAVGMLFAVGAMMSAAPMTMDSSSSSAEYTTDYTFKAMINRIGSSSSSSSSSDAPTDSPMPTMAGSTSADSSVSSDSLDSSDMLVAGSIILLISIVILYCKIYSVVLAARLRRLLLASPVLPVHVALPVDGVHGADQSDDYKPLLSEQPMYDETNPAFAHPGFVPMQPQLFYPNIQGAPSMMPPPFMYGQHPVFYTFAPAPPTNEKQ